MKRFFAFFQLIRWPNLLFIALTQFLFIHSVLNPVFERAGIAPVLQGKTMVLFILGCMLITAGGYIINDYFDANRDLITRPDSVIIGKIIHRHWAIACHSLLSAAGVCIGFYLDFTTSIHLLGFLHIGCTILLFLYSVSLKKTPIAGNLLISLLTAWTILACTWSDASLFLMREIPAESAKITKLSLIYGGFAFVVSIIREAIKDMEDIETDRKMNYHTMPIVWGMNASKVFVIVWMVVILGLLGGAFFYQIVTQRWIAASYDLVAIILPFLYLFRRFVQAKDQNDYYNIRSNFKWVMLTGILSMPFIHF